MPYEDFVREVLCCGWIDSLARRLGEDRFAIKVTPRQTTAKGPTSIAGNVKGASGRP